MIPKYSTNLKDLKPRGPDYVMYPSQYQKTDMPTYINEANQYQTSQGNVQVWIGTLKVFI